MLEFFSPKRKFVKVTLFVVGMLQVFSFLLVAPVFAQAGQPVSDYTTELNTYVTANVLLADKAKKEVDQGLLATGVASIIHAFSYFMDKIAYDTAQYVANGGKGQSALVFRKGFKSYIEDTALDAAGDFIENFSTNALGINLCQIPDPHLAIFLTLGFKSIYGKGGPQSSCSWQQFRNNWSREAFEQRYGPGGSRFLAETFSANLKVSNTDFGVGLSAIAKLDKVTAQAKTAAADDRKEGQGYKAVTAMITGNILTPSQVVQKETDVATNHYKVEANNQQLAGILASGANQVFWHAGSVFLNTLTSEMINKLLTQGMFPDIGDDGSAVEGGFYNSPQNRLNGAANPYAQLLTARPSTQVNNYNIISEFATCPDAPGMNNCVIDTDFQRALDIGNSDKPLTIQEALDKGLLHGNWPLISPKREADNASPNHDCYQGKYCYSNIQKLRKVNILPLGFEIAALRSDPDQPWTLETVVRNFETCYRVNGQGNPDPNGTIIRENAAFPFCHLINPNWIIRVPALQCMGKVITDSLLSPDSAQRREECLDVKTCINEGENGSCGGTYAYCTQEKNIWRIPGQSCPAEYNTCTTYMNNSTRQAASYLARTVDYGECSIDTVGCRAYAIQKYGAGNWLGSGDVDDSDNHKTFRALHDTTDIIYFDNAIKAQSTVCRPGNNGCTLFYGAVQDTTTGQYQKTSNNKFIEDKNVQIHLKKAPDYLKCYDSNQASPDIDWPTTLADVETNVSQSEQCNAFASVCLESEIGCEAYTPLDAKQVALAGVPQIPGMIGAQNVCSSDCVGYATFKQEADKFSNEKFPLYFIPQNGKSCDAKYTGCSEFTNIDTRAQGGEKKEYYTDLKYCEKPLADQSNIKTFYTWEGSINQGLSLKTVKILPVSAEENTYLNAVLADEDAKYIDQFPVGSPAYGDDSKIALMGAVTQCNKENYLIRQNNPYDVDAAVPDCKAYYDDAGNIFYRVSGDDSKSLNKLVTISPACHPLRKTNPEFFADIALQGNSDACLRKGGNYDPAQGTCQRCMNGGRFENNSCVYQTISAPGQSTSCPAVANGCRSYTGSTANNVNEIFNDDFEGATDEEVAQMVAPWKPARNVRISVEAAQAGAHSLEVSGPANQVVNRQIEPGSFKSDSWYEVTFWAKGSGRNVSVALSQTENNARVVKADFSLDPLTGEHVAASIDQDWHAYHLGPVQFIGATSTPLMLDFVLEGNNNLPVYIDHVRFTQVRDHIPLIKDSWKTSEGYDAPLSCDSDPLDALPGERLGCSAYKDSNNKIRFATGFEKLCREKAVGCQPLWDTFNTVEGDDADKKLVYNVLCQVNPQAANMAKVENGKCTLYRAGNLNKPAGECAIKNQFEPYCYVSKVVLEADENFSISFGNNALTRSTVIVPADTASSTPIFLANRKDFRCSETERGCMAVGLENQLISTATVSTSYKYTDMMVKNDPALYDKTLCRSDLVGCDEFKNNNNVTYFKDPKIIGNKTCVYKEKGNTDTFGWFQDGVGRCTANSDRLCRTNDDCDRGDTCNSATLNTVACYEDYQREGGMYDLWSNNTQQYDGFVGSCPNNYNLCTELIDPADTSSVHPAGQAYYVIFNNQVTSQVSKCDGKVSLSEGCVLFNKTDQPNKLYDSVATYTNSENANPKYSPVAPVSTGRSLNTNLILKVNRDRMCSRWLDCATSIRQTDASGKPVDLCYAFRECEQQEGGVCTKWVDNFANNSTVQQAATRITYGNYIKRGTSWYDNEFTGYSLYNKFRIDNMIYVSFDNDVLKSTYKLLEGDVEKMVDRQYLAYEMDGQFFTGESRGKGCFPDPANPNVSTDMKICGYDNGGRCYKNKCIYPITGVFPAGIDPVSAVDATRRSSMITLLNALTSNSCKGHPEITGPFEIQTVLDKDANPVKKYLFDGDGFNAGLFRLEVRNPRSGFSNANYCQDEECSCGYKKIYYNGNSLPDYVDLQKPVNSRGVCISGDIPVRNDDGTVNNQRTQSAVGSYCQNDNDCNMPGLPPEQRTGKCSLVSKIENHIGFKGFCLEPDYSRPTFLKNQPYECLTWLPIQVSASNVDVYNAHTSAGYDLSRDAGSGNAGQVYCSVATDVGHYLGDARYDVSFNGLPPEYQDDFNGIYKNNGSLNLVEGDDYDRDTDIHHNSEWNDYARNIVSQELKRIYTVVNSHWRNINGKRNDNQHVLRIEYNSSCRDCGNIENNEGWEDFGSFWLDPNDHGESVLRAGSTGAVYAFVPRQTFDHVGLYEFGTIMHPPRIWDNDQFENLLTNDPRSFSVAPQDVMNPHIPAFQSRLATFFMSPEASNHHLTNAAERPNGRSSIWNMIDDRVYISPLEKHLREADIESINLVPLAFPKNPSNNDEVPALMSSELVIDFNALRRLPEGGQAQVKVVLEAQADNNNGNFLPAKAEPDSVLWTYRLNNVSGSTFNFKNYNHFTEMDDAIKNNPRNQIATRYVMVYTDSLQDTNRLPSFIQSHVASNGQINANNIASPPSNSDSDPFSVPCTEDTDGFNKDWIAVGLDFNADGEFLGYISRYCNRFNAAVEMAVVAKINDSCSEFMQVYNDQENIVSGQTNKAWTQKVWTGAKMWVQNQLVESKIKSSITRSLSYGPFGSLYLAGSDVATVAGLVNGENAFVYNNQRVEENQKIAINKLRNYTFSGRPVESLPANQYSGVPYSCTSRWFGIDRDADINQAIAPDFAFLKFRSNVGDHDCFGVNPYIENGSEDIVQNLRSHMNDTDPNTEILGLFAKSFATLEFNVLNNQSRTLQLRKVVDQSFLDKSYRSNEYTENGVNIKLLPPQVFSVNPFSCTEGSGQTCSWGEPNNITVSGRNGMVKDYNHDDDTYEEDSNADGIADVNIRNGSYLAIMKFFAFANDNRMPLRQVKVDWADGSAIINSDRKGLYKNAKPFCDFIPDSVQVGLCSQANDISMAFANGVSCKTNQDCLDAGVGNNCILNYNAPVNGIANRDKYFAQRFGNSSYACSQNYFQFEHNYTCSRSDVPVNGGVPDPIKAQYVKRVDDASAIDAYTKQRLLAKGLRPESYVCVFKPRVQVTDNWEWCNGACNDVNRDGATDYKDGCYGEGQGNTCRDGNSNSWTHYKGSLIIIPPPAQKFCASGVPLNRFVACTQNSECPTPGDSCVEVR